MRALLVGIALVALICFTGGADNKPPQDKNEPATKERPTASLRVGDQAPGLKVTKWFLADPVTKFEPGKVYVVDFWATWCAPCIGNLAELAELQTRYKDQGMIVIALTCRGIRGGPDNTEKEVAAFIEKRARALRLNFALAYADDGTTADTWLKAAGQEHFSTFVVDKAGRIAYIGSHWFLDLGLPKLLAGADAKAVGDEMAKVAEEYQAVMEALARDFTARRDLKPRLKDLEQFEARYPPISAVLPVVQAKLSLLPKYGNPAEAKAYAEAIVARGIKREDVRLLRLAYSILRNEKESKASLALAVKAAEACVRIDGGKDPQSLLDVADACFVTGDTARAKEYARRAIEAAAGEPPAFRQDIEKQARKLGLEK